LNRLVLPLLFLYQCDPQSIRTPHLDTFQELEGISKNLFGPNSEILSQ